jgi:DNA polymerase elongation subunit (family B)
MKFYTNVQLIGNNILYCGYENGRKVITRDKLSPTLFVISNKKTEYKTLEGKYVEPIKFETVREARDFIKKYENVDNFDVYGNTRYLYQYIVDKFPEDEIKFDVNQMNLITLDIEVACENGFPNVKDHAEEILCITIKESNTGNITVWGVKPYENTRKDVKFIHCRDESHLLRSFIHYWTNNYPDIITGWNVAFYDIPYICGRISRVLGDDELKTLSPWKLVDRNEVNIQGRTNIAYEIMGMSVVDYMDLYKRFTYTNQESYRLDYIANVELGQKKLDHSEYENFKDFYTSDWQKFVDYNIVDVELVDRLEDKMKLIELALTMAYDAKVNYNDIHYQVRMWDNIIFNDLKKRKIAIPPKKGNKKDHQYAGAYVKEPIPGMYNWVVNFDLNSLYPHLIMQYNISPETLLNQKHPTASIDNILNKKLDLSNLSDSTVCPNGAMYGIDQQGFLPRLMEKMYNDRVIFKKKMIEAKQQYEKTPTVALEKEIARCNNIQMAKKISLNSAYGAIGNEYFRYFRIENAEAITLSGQLSILWIEKKLNQYLNKILKSGDKDYVIAIDTDSIYLNLSDLVENVYKGREKTDEKVVNFLDKVCKVELEPFIESCYQELAKYVNAYDQKMIMKRECIADKGIWTAKKRYILNVWDSEDVRYSEPKMKMMGIEAVKSSTPGPCREKIKQAIKIIMTKTEDDLIKFIDVFRDEFKKLSPEDISFPRSVNGIQKFKSSSSIYSKGTPIHVRGTLLYNHLIRQNKLTHKYPVVQEGEKIKFIYLKTPNTIGENVISFLQTFPEELNIKRYIDYDLQFEKSFLEPLKIILNTIGWKTEKTGSLEFLFG